MLLYASILLYNLFSIKMVGRKGFEPLKSWFWVKHVCRSITSPFRQNMYQCATTPKGLRAHMTLYVSFYWTLHRILNSQSLSLFANLSYYDLLNINTNTAVQDSLVHFSTFLNCHHLYRLSFKSLWLEPLRSVPLGSLELTGRQVLPLPTL